MKLFKNIEQKGPWSFIGVVLAILSIVYAVYLSQSSNTNPNLEVEISLKENIISTSNLIKDADLVYKGKSITTSEQNITYAELKFQNNSETNILKTYYDDKSPLQIVLTESTLLDNPKITNTSSNYLKENLYLTTDATGKIEISKLLIDAQESFTVGLLLLHKESSSPIISVSGKIAGQKNGIPVTMNHNTSKGESVLSEIKNDKLYKHLIRFIIYLIVAFSILLLSAVVNRIYWNFIDSKPKRRKTKIVKNYLNTAKDIDENAAKAVAECYIKSSLRHLRLIEYFSQDSKMFNETLVSFKKQLAEGNRKDILYLSSGEPFLEKGEQPIDSCFRSDLISPIVKRNLIEEIGENQYKIKDIFYIELRKLITYLERK